MSQWKDLIVLITSWRGYTCVFPQDAESPIWIPTDLFKQKERLFPEQYMAASKKGKITVFTSYIENSRGWIFGHIQKPVQQRHLIFPPGDKSRS